MLGQDFRILEEVDVTILGAADGSLRPVQNEVPGREHPERREPGSEAEKTVEREGERALPFLLEFANHIVLLEYADRALYAMKEQSKRGKMEKRKRI